MKHIPLIFAIIVTFARIISGAKQGNFYASNKRGTLSMTLLVCLVHAFIFAVGFRYGIYPSWNILVLCFALWAWSSFNAFRIWLVMHDYSLTKYVALAKNIHLYEMWVTTCGWLLGWLWLVGAEWQSLVWLWRDGLWAMYVETHTYKYALYSTLLLPLGMVGFKGFLNWGVKRPFLDDHETTNDPTGATWNIGTVNIPRPITWLRWTTLGDGTNRVLFGLICLAILFFLL